MTKTLLLTRAVSNEQYGTYGLLSHNGHVLCNTLELPWRDNKVDVSCIPIGTYPIKLHNSKRFGQIIAVENVPGRTLIRIHPANQISELLGCIAPGLGITCDDFHGVSSSARALAIIRRLMLDNKEHDWFLEIVDWEFQFIRLSHVI